MKAAVFVLAASIGCLPLVNATAQIKSALGGGRTVKPPPPVAAIQAQPILAPRGDIVTTLRGSAEFTILTKALEAANLSGTLASAKDVTLFAPTDDAFKALPPAELTVLLSPNNAALLQKVLIYHLVHLDLNISRLKGATGTVESVENGKLGIDGSGTPIKVNDAHIIQADVKASNGGLIQVIDKVLIPPDINLPMAAAGGA
jgi:uncharacterized surface protein with fasciclin (FAS1) repeats